jgi:sugar (pentulose or hexulose) kinase
MNKQILVIDIGTQSLRASVVSSKGEILSFSKRKYDVPYLSPLKGFAEQDADFYLNELALATHDIYDDHPEYLNSISGLVVDVFRDSSVILDENKKPLRNAILWLDQRVTRMQSKDYLKWYESFLFSLVGMKDTVKYNAERTSSFWLKKNEPENWKKMKYYCPLGAYFNYRITGNLAVSTADCIGHYPINFKHGKWYSKNHLKQSVFGIPYSALVDLVPVGDIIGKVSKEFSELSLIPEGTPVFACGSDKACETLGNGCIDKHSASISLGTACTIEVVDTKYSEPEKFLPSYQAPYKGSYNLEVQIYCGLWMLKWYTENFAHEELEEAKLRQCSVEEILNERIHDISAGCDGLVLQPYWQPGLKRPNAKGAIIGFSNVHTKYHLYKAIYEGLAFALREGMDEIVRKTKKPLSYLVLSGGGSNSMELCHIIADVFGLKCYISSEVESSTIGGAMAGFMDLGVFSSAQEAKDCMVPLGECIVPDPSNHKIYDKLYKQVYLKMYPSLKDVYKNTKNFYLDVENILHKEK